MLQTMEIVMPKLSASRLRRAAITVDDIRPMIRDRGVLWGRDCLRRYGARGFGTMTAGQLARLHAELIAHGAAEADADERRAAVDAHLACIAASMAQIRAILA
jgi:hypothetical protein